MNAVAQVAASPSLILFFKTETTGLPLFTEPSDDPRQPHIVQLAAELCTPDGEVVETYQTIVNIGEPISEEMTAIHGITTEKMEAEGIPPTQMLSDFFAMVDRADEVVGHNVGFDLRMVRIQSARHLGDKWECPKPTFCTCTEAKDIVKSPAKTRGKFKKPNLTETVKHFFGEDLDGAHNAMVDTTACRRIYFAIKEMKMPKEIAPGLVVETVGDILDKTDEDRAARMFAKALANDPETGKTAFDAIKTDIDDLYDEAKNWLDGAPIENQAQADAVATLIDRFHKAWKAADEQRDKEKRPHMEAANAVQAKYKPLLDRADKAKSLAKTAQATWLKKLRDEQKAIADAAAAAALKQAQEAREAIAAANAAADLDAREKAEDLVAEAKAMIADATMLGKVKAQARGEGASRAIGLKSVWIPHLTDGVLAMRHYWLIPDRRAELEALMLDMARKDVRAGARSIPGFEIKEDFTV